MIAHDSFDPQSIAIKEVNRLYRQGKAASTTARYNKIFAEYLQWAADNGITKAGYVHRPTEPELMLFAEMLQHRMAGRQVQQALSGLSAGFLDRGIDGILLGSDGKPLPRLRVLITGIKRERRKQRLSEQRALTIDKAREVIPKIRAAATSDFNGDAYAALVAHGTGSLLRVGEMVNSSIRGRSPDSLTVGNISFGRTAAGDEFMDTRIDASKTDQERRGVTLRSFANGDTTCQVAAMKRYLARRPGARPSDPLYVLDDGSFVTRARFQRVLKAGVKAAGYDPTHFNTHSMRKGGATSLSLAGWSQDTIKMMGRWSSDCYQRYLQLTDARRKEIFMSLGNVTRQSLTDGQASGIVSANGFVEGL